MSRQFSWAVVGVIVMAGIWIGSSSFAEDSTGVTSTVQVNVPDADKAIASTVASNVAAQPMVQPTGNDAGPGANGSSVPQPRPAVMEFDVNAAGSVTLDFREADIKNVLKVLAYKSGVNIISGPEVVGLVNIQLKNVPWQKALDVILSTYGYSYEQKGTVIMVTTVDALKKRREDAKSLADQEPLTTETFLLDFGKAEDVLKSLDKIKSARGSVNFDKRTNAIIISDVETNLKYVREVVARLDAVTPQVLIEAKIVETTLDKNDTLGIDWGLTAGITGGIRETTFPWTNSSRSKFFPTSPTDSTAATDPVYGTLNASGLTATLNLLKSRGNTNILSNPKIVTLDNQPAKVQVGQQYPMPQYTTNAQTGVLQVSGWSYMDIGIVFEVTPHINNAQMVTLDIQPKITAIESTLTAATGGTVSASMPVLTNESVSTSVMIKDGDTLVIAGLIKDTVEKTVKRIPILGYIPIIGWPFQNTVDVHKKKDLVIFLTPHIITPVMEKTANKK